MTRVFPSAALALGATFLAACTPTLNWREIQPEGSEVYVMFPCKPERFARNLPLAGDKVNMQMSSCVAEGTTYAMAYASVAEPGKVDAGLSELQSAASRNLGGAPMSTRPASIPGMTPNPRAQRIQINGHDREGNALTEHAVFFVKGTKVYQASVVGAKVDPEAADTFVAGLRFSP